MNKSISLSNTFFFDNSRSAQNSPKGKGAEHNKPRDKAKEKAAN